ncbi:DUF3873 family protein [Bacteroides acidifaciens]
MSKVFCSQLHHCKHTNCVAPTIKECRRRRDEWLDRKKNI